MLPVWSLARIPTAHNPLAAIDEKYLVWETDTSRYWLKKKFDGYIVRTLAYPNGSYNDRVIDAAKKIRFLQGADWSCRC